jgi:DNA-binding transcriptional regulator YiaG
MKKAKPVKKAKIVKASYAVTPDRETVFMTPDEFEAALTKLDITKNDFARLINVGGRQIRHWLSGQFPVPKLVALFVRLMIATKTKPDTIQ